MKTSPVMGTDEIPLSVSITFETIDCEVRLLVELNS